MADGGNRFIPLRDVGENMEEKGSPVVSFSGGEVEALGAESPEPTSRAGLSTSREAGEQMHEPMQTDEAPDLTHDGVERPRSILRTSRNTEPSGQERGT
jgi:hypothetical protein